MRRPDVANPLGLTGQRNQVVLAVVTDPYHGITADHPRPPTGNLQHHDLFWPDPQPDQEWTKPVLQPLVESRRGPVAAPGAVVHARQQPVSPSGGNVVPPGQGTQCRRHIVGQDWTMTGGQDPRLEGRQYGNRVLGRVEVPQVATTASPVISTPSPRRYRLTWPGVCPGL